MRRNQKKWLNSRTQRRQENSLHAPFLFDRMFRIASGLRPLFIVCCVEHVALSSVKMDKCRKLRYIFVSTDLVVDIDVTLTIEPLIPLGHVLSEQYRCIL
jgi:hypothetical protein